MEATAKCEHVLQEVLMLHKTTSHMLAVVTWEHSIITPRAHARARGYVIGRGVYILFVYYILYISLHFFLEPILYLPKYSLSEVCFNTDRLLI